MQDIVLNIVAENRRLTVLLMGYWKDLCGTQRCPLADEFAHRIPRVLLSDCFSFLPAETFDASMLCDIGKKLAWASGITTTTLTISEVPGATLLAIASRFLKTALERGTPVLDGGEFQDREGIRHLYRVILLPLEDEQGEIVQVMGGARCKMHKTDT